MSESSNKFNHNYHLNTVIDTEAPATSGGTPPTPEAPNNPNKKRRNFIVGGIATAAAFAIAIPIAIGVGSGNQSQGEKPPKATETSAPADPTEKPAPSSEYDQPVLTGEALAQAFTMPESLSGDDLARTFIQKIQDWNQYGESTATQAGRRDQGENFLVNQSTEGANTIASAMIASENLTSPLMSNFKDKMIQDNIAITEAWSKTYFADPSKNAFPEVNIEPFNQTLEVNTVTPVSNDEATGEVTMDIAFTQHTDIKNLVDPTHEGTINPTDAGFAKDGLSGTWRVTFVHENGTTKVKSIIVEG